MEAIFRVRVYYSYSQFMVFDKSVQNPGCDWTEAHCAQGFARRDSVVCFGTLLEFGEAQVSSRTGTYSRCSDDFRVIAVPFHVRSGTVVIEGPEESRTGREIALRVGQYRLIAAQRLIDEDSLIIDLVFEPLREPLAHSEILVRDSDLNPPNPLLETAGVAG